MNRNWQTVLNRARQDGGPMTTLSRSALSVGALAAAVLLLEGVLLRLLAVAQFYHFAFLVVSLALLGFGASGTLLSISPRLRALPLDRLLAAVGLLFPASVLASYVIVNFLPFDSYRIAAEPRQIVYFALYYLGLTLPFMVGGLGIGAALATRSLPGNVIYAANLLGSAAGALLALVTLNLAGVPGGLLAAAGLGLVPAWWGRRRWLVVVLASAVLALFTCTGVLNGQGQAPMAVTVSPYKGLAQALRYPGAQNLFAGWNAIARIDVVGDAGVRQLPGLSYAYAGEPPPQLGLAVDAADLQPITLVPPEQFLAAAYLPEAIAFALRPQAAVLVLEPGGGLGVLQSLAGDAAQVTAVVENGLEREAVARVAGSRDIYADARVQLALETARVFMQRAPRSYDLVAFPLTDSHQPVTNGAYSLAETYGLTVEAFADALGLLEPDGILVASRWLQMPPSESIRMLATLAEALEKRGIAQPKQVLVALRGIQTMTVLAQPDGWNADELARVRAFAGDRKLDLVWAPDIRAEETNRYNRLSESLYYQAARDLFSEADRQAFYASYPFDITPATDNRPFFYHFFKWGQTSQVLATLGRTWQPFGGSGYFLLIALLALAVVLSVLLIVVPLVLPGRSHIENGVGLLVPRTRIILYFGLLGLAFLLVEIPLIQRWILVVGHPTHAFAAVVVVLLVGSSLGSLLARAPWLPRRAAFALLVLFALATPFITAVLTRTTLGWPVAARVVLAALSLAPLAFLMGLPFPLGLAWIERLGPTLVPWAWAINGCASVIAGVLAALLSLSFGFTAVLVGGAACYGMAWLVLFGGRGGMSRSGEIIAVPPQ